MRFVHQNISDTGDYFDSVWPRGIFFLKVETKSNANECFIKLVKIAPYRTLTYENYWNNEFFFRVNPKSVIPFSARHSTLRAFQVPQSRSFVDNGRQRCHHVLCPSQTKGAPLIGCGGKAFARAKATTGKCQNGVWAMWAATRQYQDPGTG